MSFELSAEPLSEAERDAVVRAKRIARFIPLAWCVLAIAVQLLIVAAIVPRLPASIEIYISGKVSSGPGHYNVDVGGLVVTSWIVIALCSIMSLALTVDALVRKRTGPWPEALAALLACIISTALGLLVASLVPNIDATSAAAAPDTGGIRMTWAMVGLIVGLALGMLSVLWLPKKVGALTHR